MNELPALAGMDLAALLCSRVCHDVISPVGAIANGLELLDEEGDPETSAIAMDLIKSSAKNASAKLQFARIAFGAAGSAGADIDTGDAENVTRGYFDTEKKLTVEWSGERALLPKNKVKLLLNLVLVAMGAIPRGGTVQVNLMDPHNSPNFQIVANGQKSRVPPLFLSLLNGNFEEHIDAHAIQPIYTMKLAEQCGMEVTVTLEGEDVIFSAR